MKAALAQLVAGGTLSQEEATAVFEQVMTGQASAAQSGALLALLSQRGPTEDELVGAATVMRRKVVPVAVPPCLTAIDTCGTGGAHSRTFNISTTAGLIAAAAGRPRGIVVAKHGNRSVTSTTGSSQVLETLGVKLDVTPEVCTRCLDEIGFCFCFAPRHHPAMKFAAPIRAELGFRTIFNLVGPLTNPAGALRQLMGVYAPELVGVMARVLQRLGAQRAMVIHTTLPAELSTTGVGELVGLPPGAVTHFARLDGSQLTSGLLGASGDPEEAPRGTIGDYHAIEVDSPAASARLIQQVLAGEHGPARLAATYNAAVALWVGGIDDFAQCLDLAHEAVDSGAARHTLDGLIRLTQEA